MSENIDSTVKEENKEWIGHDIRKFVEGEFSKRKDKAIIEYKDGNTYLLFVNVLKELNYQFTTQPIPYGTRFEIGGRVQNA